MSFLKDKLTGAFRSKTKEEAEADQVIANRAMRRSVMINGRRRKGAGYTRAFRKGRTQR